MNFDPSIGQEVKKRRPAVIMSLQDASLSKVVLVSLPEYTPMREASHLQDDLKRAGITPYAWLINQSLSMQNKITDPVLIQRASAELKVMEEIEKNHADSVYGIPFLPEEKVLPALLEMFQGSVVKD